MVLAGDWNVVPTDDVADIYNTRSWKKDALLQPEPRAAWAQMLAMGWTDAIRARHPDAPVYTFWDYLRDRWPRNAGLRIDHLLLNAPAAARLAEADVDRDVRVRPTKPSGGGLGDVYKRQARGSGCNSASFFHERVS